VGVSGFFGLHLVHCKYASSLALALAVALALLLLLVGGLGGGGTQRSVHLGESYGGVILSDWEGLIPLRLLDDLLEVFKKRILTFIVFNILLMMR